MKRWVCASVSLAVLAVAGHAVAGISPPTAVVPEIDASGAVTALSVLAGLVALAAERLRRK
jgi:hypothetical protein